MCSAGRSDLIKRCLWPIHEGAVVPAAVTRQLISPDGRSSLHDVAQTKTNGCSIAIRRLRAEANQSGRRQWLDE